MTMKMKMSAKRKMLTCHPRATNSINNQLGTMLNPQLQPHQSLSNLPQHLNKVSLSLKNLCYLLTHCTLLACCQKPATNGSQSDYNKDDVINVNIVPSKSQQQHHTTSNNDHQSSSTNSEGDGNSDEDDLSDGDGDNNLGSLNSAPLQKKMSSKVKSLVFLLICI